jgi:hypothetical protein
MASLLYLFRQTESEPISPGYVVEGKSADYQSRQEINNPAFDLLIGSDCRRLAL